MCHGSAYNCSVEEAGRVSLFYKAVFHRKLFFLFSWNVLHEGVYFKDVLTENFGKECLFCLLCFVWTVFSVFQWSGCLFINRNILKFLFCRTTWDFEVLFLLRVATTLEVSGYPLGLGFIHHQVGFDIVLYTLCNCFCSHLCRSLAWGSVVRIWLPECLQKGSSGLRIAWV